jgi:hypothetical protein
MSEPLDSIQYASTITISPFIISVGVEEQLLDVGQESGLVQAQVIPADLEDGPLVIPGKLEAGHSGQLLVPGVRGWYSGRPRGV